MYFVSSDEWVSVRKEFAPFEQILSVRVDTLT